MLAEPKKYTAAEISEWPESSDENIKGGFMTRMTPRRQAMHVSISFRVNRSPNIQEARTVVMTGFVKKRTTASDKGRFARP